MGPSIGQYNLRWWDRPCKPPSTTPWRDTYVGFCQYNEEEEEDYIKQQTNMENIIGRISRETDTETNMETHTETHTEMDIVMKTEMEKDKEKGAERGKVEKG